MVTCDCDLYAWVYDIDTKNGIIKDIDVCEEYCTVNLEDTKNNDEDGNPLQYSYKLQFIVDMIDSGMIKTKATKNWKITEQKPRGEETFLRDPLFIFYSSIYNSIS